MFGQFEWQGTETVFSVGESQRGKSGKAKEKSGIVREKQDTDQPESFCRLPTRD
jgi:hypothetical protein